MFHKKFSIGLTLDTTLSEYAHFLDEYGCNICNVYFSLPLGDRFHARQVYASLLHDREKVALFWQFLECTIAHGIELEALFNTHSLTEDDLLRGCELLINHNIRVDKIGLLDVYYEKVRALFPDCKYVYSFKNYPNAIQDYLNVQNRYHQYVVERQYLRDMELFQKIHADKKSKVVLLINNGCSYICGGCSTIKHCHDSYNIDCKEYEPEYLHALQSVMPFELHDTGYLCLQGVNALKIASKNGDVPYLRSCLDSYIYNNAEEYIRKSPGYYLLWSRLQWHTEHFKSFDYAKIVEIKRSIYTSQNHREEYTKKSQTKKVFSNLLGQLSR